MKKIVMFSASWCNPCKQAKPVFEQISREIPEAYFQIVDIDEQRAMAEDFAVTGVPTFMLIEDGEEVKRLVGAQNVVRVKELL